MSRDWRVRVEDIVGASERAIRFLGDTDLASFRKDERSIAAVTHQIFIIGEASARIPTTIRSRTSDVPWEEIIGMRNVIAHGYFEIDVEILWKTVRLDLPPLLDEMRKLLEIPGS